jgi:hypothetical protein
MIQNFSVLEMLGICHGEEKRRKWRGIMPKRN